MTEWSDSWYRAQRKRVRNAVARLVVCVIPVAAIVLIGNSAPLLIISILVGMGIMTIVVALQGRRALRERRVLRVVPATDGRLCPRCYRPLDGLRCERCATEHTAEAVRDHWEQYPHHTATDHPSQRGGTRLWRAIQSKPSIGLALVVAMWIVLGVVWALVMRDSVIVSMIRFSNMLFMALGILLLRLGVKRYVGNAMHCAGCGYEQAAGGGAKCPECGSEWGRAGGLIRGRVVRSRGLVVAGLALFMLYPATMFVDVTPGRLASLTPTWLLMEQVEGRQSAGYSSYTLWPVLAARNLSATQDDTLTWMLIREITVAPRGFVTAEWAMLSLRTLSSEQHRGLLTGLIEKRTGHGYLTADDHAWLEQQTLSGTIPADLTDRVTAALQK